MILKQIFFIFITSLVLFACTDSNYYKIEGQLSNLDNETLYVVFDSSDRNFIDTLECDEKGGFFVVHEAIHGLKTITLYYDNRDKWVTVYPELGKTVHIKGDAKYPQLIQIKGSSINNRLAQFQKKAQPVLKELADLSFKTEENPLSQGEGTAHLANLKFELRHLAQDFIAKHPKNEASVILMHEYFSDPDDIYLVEEMLDGLAPELEDFYMVKELREYISKTKNTAVGATAPDYRVVNVHGKTITPTTFRDKYYILAFTALWNDMCHTNDMMLDDIATSYSTDSLDILLISLDENTSEVREKLQQDSISWNLVTDSVGQAIHLFEKYNVNSAPKCFLMDKNGIILLNTTNGAELKQMVEDIMN